jgi:hypothetical protein
MRIRAVKYLSVPHYYDDTWMSEIKRNYPKNIRSAASLFTQVTNTQHETFSVYGPLNHACEKNFKAEANFETK